MNDTATREILWNISSPANVVIMYTLMVFSLIIAASGIVRRAELWATGKDSPENSGSWFCRLEQLFTWGLFQRGVVRERVPAWAHTLIYFGFLVLLFTTTMVFLDNDLGFRIYKGDFYLGVTLFSDVFGFGVLIGCGIAAHRRYIKKADLVHNKFADGFILASLSLLIAQGFIIEGLRIHVTADPWAHYSPVGLLVARFFWPLSANAATKLHFFMWWFHTVTVFTVLALLPYTKFFHIVSSSANLFFRNLTRPRGALASPGDLEKLMESGEEFSLGLGTIKDYTWKGLLDLDACTSCGRCQDNCPAYLSGKPLSPKWLILDSRNHMLALQSKGELGGTRLPSLFQKIDAFLLKNFFLWGSGVSEHKKDGSFGYAGVHRASNPLVQKSALKLGASSDEKIAGGVMEKDVFWSCTSCMACVEVCPVGINHVDQIIGNRRNMVLMEGEIPSEAQPTLRALENRANPYGDPADRANWLEGLGVKILEPGDSVDYLYWVGCVSSYDPRKQKIAKALVTLMQKAGLSFGVLGNAEGCTGDPARRLGEENLFQSLAKKNIETLTSVRFKVLVANCPHCFNTIKNEYPQFGNLGNGQKPEIIHHSKLLRDLVREGKLHVEGDAASSITFHDPCYLGRYNREFDAPRETLGAVKGLNIIEMERTREKGMCCGAGGGHFWMDMKVGTRVNVLRADQAAETGASRVATACPFCMQMMEDGVKLTGREGSLDVKDIAEVLLEHLSSAKPETRNH